MELEQPFKKALSREKEFVSSVLNFSYDGIAVLDEKGIFQVYSPGMERILGYTATEIPDFEAWLKSVFPEPTLRAQVRDAFWADVRSDSPSERVFPFIHKNKERRWLSAHISLMSTKHIVVNMEDITELKRLRERDKEAAAMTERAAIIDVMADPLVVFDLNGRLVSVNPAMTRIFGREPEEIVGKSFAEIPGIVNPEDIERIMEFTKEFMEMGRAKPLEMLIRAKDGREFVTSVNYSMIKDAERKPKNLVVTFRDITERKKMEEALRASRNRLETIFDVVADALYTVDRGSLIPTLINQIKKLAKIETPMLGAPETQRIDAELKVHTEHFKELVEERIAELMKAERMAALGEAAAMIAHDLRNPLQDIRLAQYLLGKHCPNEQKLVNQIDRCVAYADGVVENLLIYGRKRPLILQEADVNQLLRKSIQESALPKYITIEEKLSELPSVYVDQTQMKRVFQNLILNAAQAMEYGGTLTVESRHVEGSLVISFKDTGVGIPEAKLGLIWRPFYTTKSKGMGLGLSIAKQIVEGHGGTINVKSKLGEGSTFTIQIPVQARNEVTSDLLMGQEVSQSSKD